jgi:hypothetical protein
LESKRIAKRKDLRSVKIKLDLKEKLVSSNVLGFGQDEVFVQARQEG